MLKKHFYLVTRPITDQYPYTMYYRRWNLRHQFIKLNIERFGYSHDMPEGTWIVTVTMRHFKKALGLRFREA